MSLFKIGDYIRLNDQAAHDGQPGLVRNIIPNVTDDERFQPYLVEFNTTTGRVSEICLQYELQHPSDLEPIDATPVFMTMLRHISTLWVE